MDTIIGKSHQQAIDTVTERVLRLTCLYKVETRDAESIEQAVIRTLEETGLFVLTLTADNGREFGNHETIAKALDADFYFAHPRTSCERGAHENSNGLVRQCFPERSDFTTITEKDLRRVERRLTNRPGKRLEMETPIQVAFGLHPAAALGI